MRLIEPDLIVLFSLGGSPNEAGREDGGDCGGAAGYVEAAINVLKVGADGGLGDGQVSSDLPVV